MKWVSVGYIQGVGRACIPRGSGGSSRAFPSLERQPCFLGSWPSFSTFKAGDGGSSSHIAHPPAAIGRLKICIYFASLHLRIFVIKLDTISIIKDNLNIFKVGRLAKLVFLQTSDSLLPCNLFTTSRD